MVSASNYLLGFTPLGYGPFMAGTVAGMSVWSIVFASLGGASRTLFKQGDVGLTQVVQGKDLPKPCDTCKRLWPCQIPCVCACQAPQSSPAMALSCTTQRRQSALVHCCCELRMRCRDHSDHSEHLTLCRHCQHTLCTLLIRARTQLQGIIEI